MTGIRWAGIAVLTLLTLMNLGTVTGGFTAGSVVGLVAGAAGLVALYGLIGRTPWSPVVALAVVVGCFALTVIAAVGGWDGRPIGLAVDSVALVLIATSEGRPLTLARR